MAETTDALIICRHGVDANLFFSIARPGLKRMLAPAAADGYDGFLALEPHLIRAHPSTGETGPEAI